MDAVMTLFCSLQRVQVHQSLHIQSIWHNKKPSYKDILQSRIGKMVHGPKPPSQLHNDNKVNTKKDN